MLGRRFHPIIFALLLLLLGIQWHSGFHAASKHLPVGKHAEYVKQQTPSQSSNAHWFDVCDLCTAQAAAHSNPFTVTHPSLRFVLTSNYSLLLFLPLRYATFAPAHHLSLKALLPLFVHG